MEATFVRKGFFKDFLKEFKNFQEILGSLALVAWFLLRLEWDWHLGGVETCFEYFFKIFFYCFLGGLKKNLNKNFGSY